ncbi:fused MFS/spermidine synthase [Corynebacterium sp. Q4381]|uniref:spermidine synthase n=1 Tax=Corynebacterium sp. Marseille-Q4381 TaxID=3121597 RepID=UPI002FE606DC
MRKPRAPKRVIAGTYPINTGTAAILPDPLRDGAFTLEVNRVPSSYVVLDAPEVLHFDYMRWVAGFVAKQAQPFTAVHLGAAGCALPSYFAHRWDSSNTAVEIDAGLAKLVRWAFDPPVAIRVAEARAFTHAIPAGSVDVIVRDVFAGPAVPRPLTTVEFFRAVRAALAPGGVYAANVGDRAGLAQTRQELAGLSEVFSHLAVAGPSAMLDGREYGNLVIAASDRPLSFDGEVPCRDASYLLDGSARPRRDHDHG